MGLCVRKLGLRVRVCVFVRHAKGSQTT